MAQSFIPVCRLTICCLCSKLFGEGKIKTCCSLTYCNDCYPKHKENKLPGGIVCTAEAIDEKGCLRCHFPLSFLEGIAYCLKCDIGNVTEPHDKDKICFRCHFELSFMEGVPYCLKCDVDIDTKFRIDVRIPILKICSVCCKIQSQYFLKTTKKDYLSCCGSFFCKKCMSTHEARHPLYLDCCPDPDSNKMLRQRCRECKNIVHLKCGSIVKTKDDHDSKTYATNIRNRDFFNSRFICNKCIFLAGIKIECDNFLWKTWGEFNEFSRTNRVLKCNNEIELFQAAKCRSCNLSICSDHITKCSDCNNIVCFPCIERHKCGTCHQCHFGIDDVLCNFCGTHIHCKKLHFLEPDVIDPVLIQKNICCECEAGENKRNETVLGRCDECKINFRVPVHIMCDGCNKPMHIENKIVLDFACTICTDSLPMYDGAALITHLTTKAKVCCECNNQVSNKVRILKPILTIFPDGIITLISEFVCQPINKSESIRCTTCQKYTCLRHLKRPEEPICINCKNNPEIDYDISSLCLDA
ncbi:MAG: hypothetical protein Hyperionvirus1_58 [Hyperionvirus sp.]|uniref:Uncharacterized protein n=1 Tax=Hyperionvirus sp. TaxID=2487770 RepID=A0A3G5AAY8_9VIRU|nr:MAG: hypothetical protein Hyperionvirus1_58 [Hyperionvirus sp.]